MHIIPPTYLSGYATPTIGRTPASLLTDGTWCGHGEPRFGVYDICVASGSHFSIRLPSSLRFPQLVAVSATGPAGETFFLYDPRKHPASVYADDRVVYPHHPAAPFFCPDCRGASFSAAVGFEVPGDSDEPDDTSWFTLAVECAQCKWSGIIFDDETA